jgi:hypothetical protein
MENNMRLTIFCILMLFVSILSATTIYDIQYTTVAGSGTYPSLLSGQIVTTSGIVTATNYANGHGYVLSMPEGGAWKGILVYENTNNPVIGDLVQITGLVYEYTGLTEIKNITAYQVLSSGNALPPAVQITTAEANTEAYEGVYVQVQNANVTVAINTYNEWTISDGSGPCVVDDTFLDPTSLGLNIAPGLQFSYLRGIGFYSYSLYRISPRSPLDIELGGQGVLISLPTFTQQIGATFAVPVNTSTITLDQGYTDFQFTMSYNQNYINYQSFSQITTLSSQGMVNITNNPGSLTVNYSGNGILTGSGILLILNFNAVAGGISPLTMTHFQYNDTEITGTIPGQVEVFTIHPEVKDTLSVIQRPLPTMPNIVLPGETMTVECTAPTTTTNWSLHLVRGITDVPLSITDANYQQSPPRWVIHASIPNMPVYDLYNLKVTASGNISDMTKHSVKVLPARKSDYYFIQITDTHLPTPLFYPDSGYDTDSTNTIDLREVIRDINIIHPEFVLITGDLINSGEMEDFQNLHWFSKAKRVLSEFDVPVYLVSGNHDIGGWSDPPPDGTSRKDWWKFFGWSWLNNSSASYPYHTQDYSFDYGPVHYIGMEAYDNYEDYLTNIYGTQSFTLAQMAWLQNDLSVSPALTNVLFYHYDFSSQLDLTQLGLDMALWGHIHSNSGSITMTPYDLSTRNCGEGNRTYRVVRVSGGSTLHPENTITAGSTGNNIQISYTHDNDGTSMTESAIIINNQSLAFPDAMVKFNMPHGAGDYSIQNGTIEQVDTTGNLYVVYARVNLLASSSVTVTLTAGTANDDQNQMSLPSISLTNSPNPFSDSTLMKLVNVKSEKATLKIYNLKGQLIRTLFNGSVSAGTTNFTWDGKADNGADASAGIFFCKVVTSTKTVTRKLVRIH